jgi:anti-sigma regulatory factor (Ser/Thr protein kinase)
MDEIDQRAPAGQGVTSHPAVPSAADEPRTFRMVVESDPTAVTRVTARLRALCQAMDILADDVEALETCAARALEHTLAHAYAGRADGAVTVSLTLRGETLSLAVEDEGNPMPIARLLTSRPRALPAGARSTTERGPLALLKESMDEVSYACVSGRNRLTFAKRVTFASRPRPTP